MLPDEDPSDEEVSSRARGHYTRGQLSSWHETKALKSVHTQCVKPQPIYPISLCSTVLPPSGVPESLQKNIIVCARLLKILRVIIIIIIMSIITNKLKNILWELYLLFLYLLLTIRTGHVHKISHKIHANYTLTAL